MSTAPLRAFGMGFGPLFVSTPLAMLALLRRQLPGDGPDFIVLAIGFAWLSDTGGYFAGRFLGKHKLYVAVSPNKTIEGAIGGLLGALVGAMWAVFGYCKGSLPLMHAVPLALVGASLGQAGDLAESLLKRSTGVKDSGGVLPGHGGILDRIDALMFTATTVYLYLLWR